MWPLASLVVHSAKRTLLRFPAPLLGATVSAALLIELQQREFRGERPFLFVLAASLALPLGTALSLFAERPPRTLERIPSLKLLAFVATLLLTAAYGAFLYASEDRGEGYLLTYAQLSLAVHLVVAFAPYLGRGATNGVWQFNRHLFLRLPLSALYAVVVFGGLAIALAAFTHLFGVKVNEDRYFQLWILSTFILQTWHFLAGVPESYEALDKDETYPSGLRIFAQFVLLPLLGLYFAILYAYSIKIVISGELPSGWVGWLVSAASAFGMLALLLLFPAREGKAGGFIRGIELAFHGAILPLLALLFVSLKARVDAYGITERRYFLGVLGAWFLVASVYRLRWGRRSLTWIPASLAVLALLTSFGPWGARSVSLASQSHRLSALLTSVGRLDGPAAGAARASFSDEREISRILDYLVETHGQRVLSRWPSPQGTPRTQAEFMSARELGYVEPYRNSPDVVSFYAENRDPIAVRGFDWSLPVAFSENAQNAGDGSPRYSVSLAKNRVELEIFVSPSHRAVLPLAPVIAQIERDRPSGKAEGRPLVVATESADLRLSLSLTQLSIEREGESWVLLSGSGTLLVGEGPSTNVP